MISGLPKKGEKLGSGRNHSTSDLKKARRHLDVFHNKDLDGEIYEYIPVWRQYITTLDAHQINTGGAVTYPFYPISFLGFPSTKTWPTIHQKRRFTMTQFWGSLLNLSEFATCPSWTTTTKKIERKATFWSPWRWCFFHTPTGKNVYDKLWKKTFVG